MAYSLDQSLHNNNKISLNFFPRFYRFITEQEVEIAILSLVVIIALFFISNDLLSLLNIRSEIQSKRQKILSQIDVWNDTLLKYPGYRDGYFHNSVLAYELHRFPLSNLYLDKAMQIDPEFEYGIVIKAITNKEIGN